MNDWVAEYATAKQLVEEAHALIFSERLPIKFVNARFWLYNGEKSGWLYDVDFQVEGEQLAFYTRSSGERLASLPLETLKELRLRPYYYAACVGFKNFVFVHKHGK